MPVGLVVFPPELLAAAPLVRRGAEGAEQVLVSLRTIALRGHELLGALRSADALAAWAAAWQPVLAVLAAHAQALAAGLAYAGGEYTRIDGGLAGLGGITFPPVVQNR